MIFKLLILACIGGLIGWMTNVLAIKLLFRPIEPIKIPIINADIQGLMPKRKADIAKNIGVVVSEELVSIEDIIDDLVEDLDKTKTLQMIKDKIIKLADEKMPAIVPGIMKMALLTSIGQMIDENGEALLVEFVEQVSHEAIERVDIAKLVEEKINGYDFEKIEEMTLYLAKKELKHIEYLGGLIGFIIGIGQGIIVLTLM